MKVAASFGDAIAQADETIARDVAPERPGVLVQRLQELEDLRAQVADLVLADNRVTQRKAALEKVLGRLTSVGKESANAGTG